MRLTVLFVFATLVGISRALSPGAQIQIAQSGIDAAVHSLIDYISNKFQSISISDIEEKHVHVYNIMLNQFSVDQKSTGITLRDNGDINFHVGGINVRLDADFKAKWSVFHTSGTIDAKASDASFDITLNIVNENEKPRITNKGVNVNLGSLDINVHGSIISWILDLIADLFKGKIKSKGEEKLQDMLNDKIQQLSDKVAGIITERPLGGKLDGFFIDYGLTSNPSVANSAFIVPAATQFWYKDHKNQASAQSSGDFPFGAPWQMACVDVDTNLVFGTFIYGFNVSDKGVITIGNEELKNFPLQVQQFFECNCTGDVCLVTYFPKLADYCPKDSQVGIEAIVKVEENLYFNDSGIFALASSYSSFMIVETDNTKIKLLDLEADVGVHLLQNVTFNNWTVKGEVEVYYTNLQANSTIAGDIDTDSLANLWDFVLRYIAQNMANSYLDAGIPLPPLDFATFSNTKVGFNGQFIRLCTDLSVNFGNILN